MESDPEKGQKLFDEAVSLINLYGSSSNPVEMLESAVFQLDSAACLFPDESKDFERFHAKKAEALVALSKLQPDPESLLEKAVQSYDAAIRCASKGSEDFGVLHNNRATVLFDLSKLNPDPQPLLDEAILSYDVALQCAPEESELLGVAQNNRGNAFVEVSKFATHPETFLEEAIRAYEAAIASTTGGSENFGIRHHNRADALFELSKIKPDPEPFLLQAIRSSDEAIPCAPAGSEEYGNRINKRAMILVQFSKINRYSGPFLQEAIRGFDAAIQCVSEGSEKWGLFQMCRGTAYAYLSESQADPESLIQESLKCYEAAIPCFPDKCFNIAICHRSRANALQVIARRHANPPKLLKKSLEALDNAGAYVMKPTERLELYSSCVDVLLSLANLSSSWAVASGWFLRARNELYEANDFLEDLCKSRSEESRRILRTRYHRIFLLLAEVCLQLADHEADPQRAENLRQEAWDAVGLSKGRSLREGIRRQTALGHEDVFQGDWEQLLERFTTLKRMGGGYIADGYPAHYRHQDNQTDAPNDGEEDAGSLLLYHWHRESLALEVPLTEVPPINHWMGSLACIQPEGITLVADFLGFTDHSCRVLLHEAGMPGPIAAPVILSKGMVRAAELSQHLQAALDWISEKGSRDGSVRRLPGCNLRSAPPRAPFMGRLDDVHDTVPHSIEDQFESLLEHAIAAGRWNELAGALAGWHAEPETKQAAHGFCRRLAEILFECVSEMPREDHRSNSDWRQSAGILGAVTPEMAYGAGITPAQFQAFDDEAKAIMKNLPKALGEILAPLQEAISARSDWKDALLVLCPTGPFHLLPLAAAHWGSPETTLIENHAVVHLPTACYAHDIIERRRQLDKEPPAKRRAFLAATDPSGILKNIHKEVNVAGDRLRQAGFDVECVQDSKAKAQCMRNQEEADVVHLAMHSGIDPQFELSGLEFHDRRLTVVELLTRVRLRRAKLAIVATCSSWQVHGDDIGADDPLALARCWSLAGANSVVGTLWPLQDDAAMMFSHTLYECMLEEGLPLARAVRRAVVTLKKHQLFKNNPYAWAPFLLVGDPATKL